MSMVQVSKVIVQGVLVYCAKGLHSVCVDFACQADVETTEESVVEGDGWSRVGPLGTNSLYRFIIIYDKK